MDDELADTVAVVTGGASGIGRSICLTFARAGADVVVADVRKEPREGGQPTHRMIPAETDVAAEFVECDVTDRDAVESAVDAAEDLGTFGVMVNNAGVGASEADPLDIEVDEFDRIMNVNAKGAFIGCQVAGRRLRKAGAGAIVNMSSTAGIRPGSGSPVYSMSKGAIRLLTYSMADALGPAGVRVNAIHPGTIATEMSRDFDIADGSRADHYERTVALGRLGRPTDVAEAACYLASDRAAYVNGASLVVDGGRTNLHPASSLDPTGQ